MSLLKKEIDDANNKVEQSEGLVVKLENEIVEWNAFKKEIQDEIMINEDIASHYHRSIYIIQDLNNQIKE